MVPNWAKHHICLGNLRQNHSLASDRTSEIDISWFSVFTRERKKSSICSKKGKNLKATLESIERVAERCSVKKVVLKISQNSQETPVVESLF